MVRGTGTTETTDLLGDGLVDATTFVLDAGLEAMSVLGRDRPPITTYGTDVAKGAESVVGHHRTGNTVVGRLSHLSIFHWNPP